MFEKEAKPLKYYKRKKLRKMLKGVAPTDSLKIDFKIRAKDPDVPFGDHFRVTKVEVSKGFGEDSLIISSKELDLVYAALIDDNKVLRNRLKLQSILIKDLKKEAKLHAKDSDKRRRSPKSSKSKR